MNLRILVCTRTCYDKPQEQIRPISLPADPVPTFNARPESFASDDAGVSVSQSVVPPVFSSALTAQQERAIAPLPPVLGFPVEEE